MARWKARTRLPILCILRMFHMIYWCNMRYSLLVEGLFRYNTLFLLGSHHQRYNEVAVYVNNAFED